MEVVVEAKLTPTVTQDRDSSTVRIAPVMGSDWDGIQMIFPEPNQIRLLALECLGFNRDNEHYYLGPAGAVNTLSTTFMVRKGTPQEEILALCAAIEGETHPYRKEKTKVPR